MTEPGTTRRRLVLLARAEAAGVVILREAKVARLRNGLGSEATALAKAAALKGGRGSSCLLFTGAKKPWALQWGMGHPGSTALAIAAAAGGGQGSGGPEVVQGGSKWVELRWKTEARTATVLFASCAKRLR